MILLQSYTLNIHDYIVMWQSRKSFLFIDCIYTYPWDTEEIRPEHDGISSQNSKSLSRFTYFSPFFLDNVKFKFDIFVAC